jgi:beta-glucosidase
VPVYYNHKPSGGRTHWQGTYVDELTTPLFPFGFGLSYTRFEYSDLTISPTTTEANGTVHIGVTVCNLGDMEGDEVVQLYLGDPVATVTRPVQSLKGFARVTLAAGQARRLTFALDARHAAFYDQQMRYVVEPGTLTVGIGASSADIRLRGSFTVEGAATEVEQVFSTPVILE